jgi:N-carbamoylputrescine amidase
MQGHAVSNTVPVIAANRIGHEEGLGAPQTFYGQSVIADHTGEIVSALGDSEEGILVHEFDLAYLKKTRSAWGFFRDRRSDLYDL